MCNKAARVASTRAPSTAQQRPATSPEEPLRKGPKLAFNAWRTFAAYLASVFYVVGVGFAGRRGFKGFHIPPAWRMMANVSAARRRYLRSRTTPHSSVMRLDRQSATRLLLTTSAGRNSRRALSVDAEPPRGHRHSSVPSLAVTTHCSISIFLCARRLMALDLQVQPHQKRLTAFPPAPTWPTAILHCLALMVPRGCRRSRVSHDRPAVSAASL